GPILSYRAHTSVEQGPLDTVAIIARTRRHQHVAPGQVVFDNVAGLMTIESDAGNLDVSANVTPCMLEGRSAVSASKSSAGTFFQISCAFASRRSSPECA